MRFTRGARGPTGLPIELDAEDQGWNAMRWSDRLRGRDILVISPQYWGGMWVSKHWIASELSRCNRVLFVEPPTWIGGLVKRPSSLALELPRAARPFRRISHSLAVFAPRLWPGFLGDPKRSVTSQVRRQVERLGFRDCIALNFTTDQHYVHHLGDRTAVYYCVDPAFPQPGEEDDEALMCRKSDLVYAISDAYRDQLHVHDPGKPVHVIPHGFAFHEAQRVMNDPAVGIPSELARLGRPILGFVGSIHDSYVDIDLLESISRQRPDDQIALIGPYKNNPVGPDISAGNLRRIRQLKNVHLLGFRPFNEVHRYVKFFDVGLVLIETRKYDREYLNRKRTLFKLLHYFSQGKPIIIPDLYEVGNVSELLYIARDAAEYVAHIDAALHEATALRVRRIDYASRFSYESILDRIVQPIVELERPSRGGNPPRLISCQFGKRP
jgi:hypothetical protein